MLLIHRDTALRREREGERERERVGEVRRGQRLREDSEGRKKRGQLFTYCGDGWRPSFPLPCHGLPRPRLDQTYGELLVVYVPVLLAGMQHNHIVMTQRRRKRFFPARSLPPSLVFAQLI